MSSEALRIAMFASLALGLNDFGCEISIKQNIASASKIQEKLAYYNLFHDLALWGVRLKNLKCGLIPSFCADNHEERE